jgi:hypothetical protein
MSLALAAKHLESQGRNKDTKLVHMTPEELRALNKLSLDHNGKPLSTNPKTGLPEAGFLESILPTVAGIAGTAMFGPAALPYIAGGVGLLSYAMTGDIGQGIMAGLGAWSGGKLGADIRGAADLAQVGGNSAAAASDAAARAALDPSVYSPISTMGAPSMLGTPSLIDATGGLANIGTVGTTNALGQTIAPQMAQKIAGSGFSAAPSNWDTFTKGVQGVMDKPGEFFARDGVKLNTAMAAAPLVFGALQPDLPKLSGEKEPENPFGFKKLSKDFKGSFPTQPNPYYTAQYPDYRAKPYGMNKGGLADVEKFKAGGYKELLSNISLMKEGLAGLEPDSTQAPITPTDPGYKYSPRANAIGIALDDEKEFEGMSPDQRAYAMMKSIRKRTLKDDLASGLQPVGSLGNIDLDPAMVRDAKLAAQAKQQIAQEAKSGGLMDSHLGDYSDGGRLLKGPGDGVSDSIPATIGGKQAARLAEGEFVIPARIVSELGNGSTDAGAKRLYAMMDRVKAKRRKAKDIAADTKSYKLLPA